MRTTVEDLGRREAGRWGVPRGGAFDAQALAAANLLVGNEADCAGLELTLKAPELEALEDVEIAYVGADFALAIQDGATARALEPGRAARLPRGTRLGGAYAKRGARAWLAIGGGVDVPPVLGSRATEATGGFGGFQGRPLAGGDVLPIRAPASAALAAVYRDPVSLEAEPLALRVLPGPQLRDMPTGFREALEAGEYTVGRDSDRTGVRFARAKGEPLPPGWPREIEPEGALAGAIQLPPDGAPIALGVDGPTTGGYAKPAVVIRADLSLLARLAPSMRVVFRFVTPEEADAARALERERLAMLAR
jgi:biotin-dependent carboxylase-like uncharacterized protein